MAMVTPMHGGSTNSCGAFFVMAVTLDTLVASGASDVAIDRINNRIYVAQRSGDVTVFDLVTRQAIDSFFVPGNPRAISFSPEGNQLAVTADRAVVYRIDLATRAVTSIDAGRDFQDVEFIDAGQVLLTDVNGRLVRLDLATAQVTVVGFNNAGAAQLLPSRSSDTIVAIAPGPSQLVQVYDIRSGALTESRPSSGAEPGSATGVAATGVVFDVAFVTATTANQYDSRHNFMGTLTFSQRVDGVTFDSPGTDILLRNSAAGTINRYALFGEGLIESNGRGSYAITPSSVTLTGSLGYGNQLLVGRGDRFIVSSQTNSFGSVELIDTGYTAPAGTSAADTLVGSSGAETIAGLAGDDRVYALAGDDTVDGGDGNDALFGGQGADLVRGGDGNDIVASTDQNVSFFGEDDLGTARDTLLGGAGNDTIAAGFGDQVDGGSGFDQLRLSLAGSTTGLTVDLGTIITGTARFGDAAIDGIESVARVLGTSSSDRFVIIPQTVSLTINGGGGIDTADFSNFQNGISIDLNDQAPTAAIRLLNIRALVGSAAADRLLGNGNPNELTGGAGNDVLVGREGSDTLIGGSGNDTLDGGSSADTLIGGVGDDVYVVEESDGFSTFISPDTVVEAQGEGFDTVFAKNSYALLAGIEIEVLSTENNVLTASIDLTGNEFAQTIVGNFGANRLTGGGGADTLIGLRGDDTYIVSTADTVIRENAGEGNDTAVISALNYQLAGDAEVETLSAAAGTATINIAGNGFGQVINGNDGANILSTGGGAPDTLNGGLGDDVYRVFSTGDVINDTGGFDTVYASGTSYFLYSTAAVEYLSTSEQAGTQGFYMVGNGASQVIVGNYGDNTLNGRGGDGVALPDTLIGLFGNDIYGVFSQGDVVREVAGQGNDVVFASASYQLRAGTEIEVLSAVNQSAGDAGSAYTLRGNEIGQIVAGNNAANVLDGRGGNDTLVGLGGADTFAFTTALDGTNNVDTVRDFASGSDKVGLASDVFAAVTDGGIVAGEFVIGTAAADADDRLVYDQATGRLFFDADGNGSGAAVLFAQFGAGTSLAASDVVVVAPVASLAAG